MEKKIILHVVIESPMRLDAWLSTEIDMSRTFIQSLIKKGHVKINGTQATTPSIKTKSGDSIEYTIPKYKPKVFDRNNPAFKEIKIIFQHQDFVVINKPPGISTHQAHEKDDTPSISDFVYAHSIFTDDIRDEKRIGIVHRLDKDTSGIMLIARTYSAQLALSKLFEDRLIQKTYIAVTQDKAPESGSITYHIARSPINPTRMTHARSHGKAAQTDYTRISYNEKENISVVECRPKTGRTHQIRVHLTAIGHPIIGDTVYGKKSDLINRHALHAYNLEFIYQETPYNFSSDVSADMAHLANTI